VATALGRVGFTPNALTVLGFAGTCVAAVAAAAGWWAAAGVLVAVFAVFDLFDGALARATGRASRFGAFLDSTLDRTGENLVLGGVAVGCAIAGFIPGVALASAAMAFASVVTYARARAESIGLKGEVGIAPRSERVVVLAVGLVLAGALGGVGRPVNDPGAAVGQGSYWLAAALAVVAVTSAITVLQRMLFVRRQLSTAAEVTTQIR
jgi:CDP-diacylglycerol--glycerol-3-phosphate 3-phosphatidyltransferase